MTDRILKATWTLEAQQDLCAWYNLETELSYQTMQDIDREIIRWTNLLSPIPCEVNWKKEGF